MLLWLMSLPAPDPLAGQGCSGASRGPRRWGWYTRPEHLGNRIWGRCMKYTHLENRQCRVKFSRILGFQSIRLTDFFLAEIRMKAPTAVREGQRGWKRVGWYLTRPRPGTRCEKGTMQLQRVWLGGWRPTKGWSEPSHAPTCDWPTMHSHKPSGNQLKNPDLSVLICWPWKPKVSRKLSFPLVTWLSVCGLTLFGLYFYISLSLTALCPIEECWIWRHSNQLVSRSWREIWCAIVLPLEWFEDSGRRLWWKSYRPDIVIRCH